MVQLDGVSILICQPFFSRYSGSELVTLELAQAVADAGAHARVVTWFASEQMHRELLAIPGARLDLIDSPELAEELDRTSPDIVWSHQGLVPLMPPGEHTRYVFAHLSSFNSFEYSFNPRVERALADRVYFVSEEARDEQTRRGAFRDFDPSLWRVFGNPAPRSFHEIEDESRASGGSLLSSLLVVSNHLPPEIVEVVQALRRDGITVDVVGMQRDDLSATPRRVTAELLAGHDAVLTIGKTVQYGLCVGRPVFCYDHFGGPGWIGEDNVGAARYHNFSGRGFSRRPSQVLLRELREGFCGARAFAVSRRETHRGEFAYGRVVEDLAELAVRPQASRRVLPAEEFGAYLHAHRAVGDFGRAFYSSEQEIARRAADLGRREQMMVVREQNMRELQDHCEFLERSSADRQREVDSLKREIDSMRGTVSWRLTRPLRAVRGRLHDRR